MSQQPGYWKTMAAWYRSVGLFRLAQACDENAKIAAEVTQRQQLLKKQQEVKDEVKNEQ